MAIIDGILNLALRNPFDDKSKFFKKNKYVFEPRLILGAIFALVGVIGFAASGLTWEFKGIELGLTASITSFFALLFSIVFLFPFASAKQNPPARQNNTVQVKTPSFQKNSEVLPDYKIEPALTTAEEIRTQLALSEKEKPAVVMTNFSTNYLIPGNSLLPSKRKAGKSLDAFRKTAKSFYNSKV